MERNSCPECGAPPTTLGKPSCYRHDCPNMVTKTVSLDVAQDARIRSLEERLARIEKKVVHL